MIEVKINEEALSSIIKAAVDEAVKREREKQSEIKLIDSNELCKRFGVSALTVKKWRDRKEIPYVKIDGIIRYDFNKIVKLKEQKRKF